MAASRQTTWKSRIQRRQVVKLLGRAESNGGKSSNYLEEQNPTAASRQTTWKSGIQRQQVVKLLGRRLTNRKRLSKAMINYKFKSIGQ